VTEGCSPAIGVLATMDSTETELMSRRCLDARSVSIRRVARRVRTQWWANVAFATS